MSTWWEELLNRMFGAQVQAQDARGRAFMDMGRQINTEVQRQEAAATSPTPTPTPTPTGATPAQANPNLREQEQIQSAIQSEIGTVPTSNPLYGSIPQGKVYLGQEWQRYGAQTAESTKMRKGDKTGSVQEVIEGLNDWSEKKRRKFAELAVDAGLLKAVTTNYDDLEPLLGQLAIRSAKLYQRGIKTTPWGLLERYAKSGSVAGGPGSGPITTTTVNRSIDITSSRDANALVDAALQQRLGRSPTDKEKKEFLEALNAAEKKEPKVTKSTTTTTGTGTENVSSSTSSTTSGGVDTANFAREWSMSHNKDEAGSYQALAFYMPLFYQALGAPV